MTVEPITTGSGAERTVECRASSVLPRAYRAGGTWARRGTAIHAYLERISNGMEPAESLLLVEEEYRPAAEAVDLPVLAEDLQLSAEVAFAYNPVTDTARELGRSLDRDYSSITSDEWPLTIDVAGLASGVGIVRDYKTGYTRLAPTRGNWQMRGAAIAIARTFDVDQVDAQLIYLRDGRPVWRDRAAFDAFELAGIAAELRQVRDRVLRDREAAARGEVVPPSEGSWCRYCPSWSSCPAKATLVRWALTGEGTAEQAPISGEQIVSALEKVRAGKKALEHVERELLALADNGGEPMLIEIAPDGTETWLGKHQKPGNEKLDPQTILDVAADVLSVSPGDRQSLLGDLVSITKAALERAVKARVARGDAARALAQILDGARARGGVTRPTTESVGIFTRRPALAAGGK